MQTGHELFLYEMSDMLDAERQLVEALRQLEADATLPQLKHAFAEHGRQTEGHVERLEQCFERLGVQPSAAQCAGIRGLVQEKSEFMDENPESDILDVFEIGAGIKTETYEICAYESLISMSEEMNHTPVTRLLKANLKEEIAALKKLQGFSKKIKPSRMREEEEEESEGAGLEETAASSGAGRRRRGAAARAGSRTSRRRAA